MSLRVSYSTEFESIYDLCLKCLFIWRGFELLTNLVHLRLGLFELGSPQKDLGA